MSFVVGEPIQIVFAIPNTDVFLNANGKVIWDDKHGKTGIDSVSSYENEMQLRACSCGCIILSASTLRNNPLHSAPELHVCSGFSLLRADGWGS